MDAEPRQDEARADFLAQLRRVGDWPQRPLKIGVANGIGSGKRNGVPPGVEALRCTGPYFRDTVLYTQAGGNNRVVAELKGLLGEKTITTSGLPDLDGAPGGTLDSFGILADALKDAGEGVDVAHRTVSFVPSVSAVAIRDIETNEDLHTNIDALPPEESELDEIKTSSRVTAHTRMTEELGKWIIERIAR